MNAAAPEPAAPLVFPANPQAIVLGASAGAVEALLLLLPALPADYPLPLLLLVHSPPQRDSALVDIFQAKCRLRVKEAEDKEPIESGTVYLAPPDYHLLVEPNLCLALSSEEPVWFCRPAIDPLFETAAEAYGPGLIGIILTGANEDGARGLANVVAQGGTALVQDPREAQANAMPNAALRACPGAKVLTLAQIARFLCRQSEPSTQAPV